MLHLWSDWRPFPDPRRGDLLTAPFGPGVYELRRSDTLDLVLFGIGRHVCARMTSLLPLDLGSAGRNNTKKREYVLQHLAVVEYRTMACANRDDAALVERALPRDQYCFGT